MDYPKTPVKTVKVSDSSDAPNAPKRQTGNFGAFSYLFFIMTVNTTLSDCKKGRRKEPSIAFIDYSILALSNILYEIENFSLKNPQAINYINIDLIKMRKSIKHELKLWTLLSKSTFM